MITTLPDPTVALLSLTLGEYLFDQWGGDWQRGINEYSKMLDAVTLKEIIVDFERLISLSNSARTKVFKEWSAYDFRESNSNKPDYLKYVMKILLIRIKN